MSVEDKLEKLGIQLPPPPQPAGAYTPAIAAEGLVFVSGQLPLADGVIQYPGILGRDLEIEAGYAAARLCALNALSILKVESGDLNKVSIVRLGGYVAASDYFTGHPKVMDGASDLMAEILGIKGIHARLAVGVSSLPMNAAVELEVIAAVS